MATALSTPPESKRAMFITTKTWRRRQKKRRGFRRRRRDRDPIRALARHTLHQPFRRGGGTANPYALNAGEPRRIDQFGVVDQMRISIDLATGLEKHTPVAAFESADEENEVVALGKFLHPGQSIRNAAANRVVTTELCRRLYVGGEVIDECLKTSSGLVVCEKR